MNEWAAKSKFAVAAFVGLAVALSLGVYLPMALPGLSDFGSFAIFVFGTLGIVVLALVVTHSIPLRAVPGELGMDRSPIVGLAWSFAVTFPMLIGFLILRQGVFFEEGGFDDFRRRPWAVLEAWAGAGLVEETLFRGYFFRQLVLRSRWSTTLGILVCGAIFGLLHIPSAWVRPPGEIAGAVLVTAIGGAAFCWLLKEWNWNLWFVVGWHAFVNLWWMLGQAGDSAVGSPLANWLRLGIVALTIVVTVNRQHLPRHWLGLEPEHPETKNETRRNPAR